jgi:hypothetical protein
MDGSSSGSSLQQDGVDGQYVFHLFKWIKQHLRIKAFYGTSENAVKTQIWIAVSVYVLVAVIRKRLGAVEHARHTIKMRRREWNPAAASGLDGFDSLT